MWYQICRTWPICPQNHFYLNVQKLRNIKNKKESTIFGGFWGQNKYT